MICRREFLENRPQIPTNIQPPTNPGIVQQHAVDLGSFGNLPTSMIRPQGAAGNQMASANIPTSTQQIPAPSFGQQPNVPQQNVNPTFNNMSDLHNFMLSQGRRLRFSRRGRNQGPPSFGRR